MVNKIKFYNNFKVSEVHKRSILLIGNFDGLHLGHQKLFKLANKYKKKFKLKILKFFILLLKYILGIGSNVIMPIFNLNFFL